MPPKKARREIKIITAIGIAAVVIVGGMAGIKLWLNQPTTLKSKAEPKIEPIKKPTTSKTSASATTTPPSTIPTNQVHKPIKPQPVIDVNLLGKDQHITTLMAKRKTRYGSASATTTPPSTVPTNQVHKPIKPQPVIDVNLLGKDRYITTLMAKRKAKYGIDKGIDLIVKPDESIKIGNTTVPMQEILDKIRLKKGDFIEKDLTSKSNKQKGDGNKPDDHDNAYLLSKLKEMEERYLKIEEKVAHANGIENQKVHQNHIKERARLGNAVSLFRKYKQTIQEIDKKREELSIPTQGNNLEDKPIIVEKQYQPKNRLNEETSKTTTQNETENETSVLVARKEKPENGLKFSDDLKRKSIFLEEEIKAEDRFFKKNKNIRELKTVKPDSAYKPTQNGSAELDKNVLTFKKYKQTLKTIDGKKGRLTHKNSEKRQRLQEEINALNLQKEKLENELKALVSSERKSTKDDGEAYGVYVVRPDDNLWDVHFSFLKEYFDTKGATLELSADEPDKWGRSSGVGRLLKFSELMVFIYNVKDRKLSLDLNSIHPFSKIVVFNMGEVFSLLNDIDYGKIDRIRFDGDTIWIPAESTAAR